MRALFEDHSVWIAIGWVVMAVALFVGRRLNKGEEPRQFGDEVK